MFQKIFIFEILIILLPACRSAVHPTLPSLVLTETCLMRRGLSPGLLERSLLHDYALYNEEELTGEF